MAFKEEGGTEDSTCHRNPGGVLRSPDRFSQDLCLAILRRAADAPVNHSGYHAANGAQQHAGDDQHQRQEEHFTESTAAFDSLQSGWIMPYCKKTQGAYSAEECG